MNIVTRTSNLSPYLKSCTQVIGTQVKPLAPASVLSSEKVIAQPAPDTITPFSLSRNLPSCGNIKVSSGPTVGMQVRYAHTDIQVPDFSHYRRSPTLDPTHKNSDSAPSRKSFTYLLVGGGAIGAVVGAKGLVHFFVGTMSASADVLALAKIEVKLNDIPEGKSVTFKWRGKPLFIRHRTGEEIQTEQNVNVSSLRDPQADSERVQKPEWLVVIGVCTHLGCVPIANAGEFGGYYCPCHGSHYDASGRIRKGPAPLNLEVPAYEFQTDDLLVVG